LSEVWVEYYYNVVKGHLERMKAWSRLIQKFPPQAVRAAVKGILERIEDARSRGIEIEADDIDWGSLFEGMIDYDKVESFLKAYEDIGALPRKMETMIEEELDREEGWIVSAIHTLEERPELVDKYAVKLAKLMPTTRELAERLEKVADDRDEAVKDREKYKAETEKWKSEAEKLKSEIEELRRRLEEAKPAITLEQLKRLEEMFRGIIYRELGRVPRDAMSLFTAEQKAIKSKPYEEAVKHVEELAKEVIRIEREKALPPPKVLPPTPEKCPIDGTELKEVTRVPIGPVPIRLEAEEEYFRARLGLPVPEKAIITLDVPPTMKLYMCEKEHMFERDPAGRLVQRTPEYVYRKIVRETAALRGIVYPGAPAVAAPRAPPTYRPISLQELWWSWLEQVKGINRWDFLKLSEEEQKKLRDEWIKWRVGMGG
jgi:hypothetical protein